MSFCENLTHSTAPVVFCPQSVTNSFKISNLDEIIGKQAQSFMIYGRKDCFYAEIYAAGLALRGKPLTRDSSITFKKVYDYSLGESTINLRPNNSFMVPIVPKDTAIKSICKNALTVLMTDNYIRTKTSGSPITPLLFAIESSHMDREEDPVWQATPESVLSKTETDDSGELYNEYITASELRRLHKLCTDKDLPAPFRQFVRANCFFVHVIEETIREQLENVTISTCKTFALADKVITYTYRLVVIPAPWERENGERFTQLFQERVASKSPSSETPSWKAQVLQHLSTI
jgi:hypothetical protein